MPKYNILRIVSLALCALLLSLPAAAQVSPDPGQCQAGPDAFAYHMEQGGLMRGLGNPEQAFIEYDCALRIQPDSGLAYRGRARTHFDRGLVDLALADYNLALDYLPDDPITLNNLGLTLARMSYFPEAADYYTRALILDPDYSLVFLNRGIVYQEMERIDDALADFEAAIELNHQPEYLPYYYIAELWRAQGSLPEAIYWYESAVGINPDFAQGWKMLGDLRYERGDYAQAGTYYERYLYLENQADATVLQRVARAQTIETILRYLPTSVIVLILAYWAISLLRKRLAARQTVQASPAPDAEAMPESTPLTEAAALESQPRRWWRWSLTLPVLAVVLLGLRQLFGIERR